MALRTVLTLMTRGPVEFTFQRICLFYLFLPLVFALLFQFTQACFQPSHSLRKKAGRLLFPMTLLQYIFFPFYLLFVSLSAIYLFCVAFSGFIFEQCQLTLTKIK